jgi:Ca2+:H+ antiporter
MNFKWLLICVPLGICLDFLSVNPLVVFIASSLAIIPLAQLIGDATEEMSHCLGAAKGGLLNSTMGTVPDLIIGFFALQNGLIEMVKASITGAIIGNLLFGLGLSILAGGIKNKAKLHYDRSVTHIYSSLLLLTTFGLIIPAVFEHSVESDTEISLTISIILLVIYISSVIFTLTNVDINDKNSLIDHDNEQSTVSLFKIKPLIKLVGSGIGLAIMSEIMTDAIGPTADRLGLSPIFAGVFLLAPIGMVSELINTVRFSRENKFDISLALTLGSSTQIGLLVAPLLVFMGLGIGQDMNLLFSKFEVIAIILSVAAVNHILHLGSVSWVSGPKLIGIYFMLGIAFFNIP